MTILDYYIITIWRSDRRINLKPFIIWIDHAKHSTSLPWIISISKNHSLSYLWAPNTHQIHIKIHSIRCLEFHNHRNKYSIVKSKKRLKTKKKVKQLIIPDHRVVLILHLTFIKILKICSKVLLWYKDNLDCL